VNDKKADFYFLIANVDLAILLAEDCDRQQTAAVALRISCSLGTESYQKLAQCLDLDIVRCLEVER